MHVVNAYGKNTSFQILQLQRKDYTPCINNCIIVTVELSSKYVRQGAYWLQTMPSDDNELQIMLVIRIYILYNSFVKAHTSHEGEHFLCMHHQAFSLLVSVHLPVHLCPS